MIRVPALGPPEVGKSEFDKDGNLIIHLHQKPTGRWISIGKPDEYWERPDRFEVNQW